MIANDGVHAMSRGRRLRGSFPVQGRAAAACRSIGRCTMVVRWSITMVNFDMTMRFRVCVISPGLRWDTCHAHATVAYNIYIMFSKYLRRLA